MTGKDLDKSYNIVPMTKADSDECVAFLREYFFKVCGFVTSLVRLSQSPCHV